jgi:hypothetical protein
VQDVLPYCDCYRGDSGSPWGLWCEDIIAKFDSGGVVNGTQVPAHELPENIGADADHPIYYFAAARPKTYVLYLPPANALPTSAASGRYEYFLFQYLKSRNIGVFVLHTPEQQTDLWDHVPPYNQSFSPYHYNCAKIKSGYDFCYNFCNMCSNKGRSTRLIEAAIDKAAAMGYTEQLLIGWSSGGAMASAFLNIAHNTGFKTVQGTHYVIKGLVLLASGGQFCYAYDSVHDLPVGTQAGSEMWTACTAGDRGPTPSCCPQHLTEEYYWRNPHLYSHHPPTLVVQTVSDCNADIDAARFYHETMLRHNASSAFASIGGSVHEVSPAAFGVIASWIFNLLGERAMEATLVDF